MGRRISDHAGRELLRVQLRLPAEVLDVDVAVGVGPHHHDAHAAHLRRGRVGAVGRGRDEADGAVPVPPGQVVGPDGEEPGIFALCAGIRLHRNRVVAGDGAELVREIRQELVIARRLIRRHKRVEFREFRPGDRQHLGGGVELQGAGAERDHRPVEGQIAVREARM